MHEYYHRDGVTDLSKMREEASARLNGTGMFRGAHEESIIHFHAKHTQVPVPGDKVSCKDYVHEYYTVEKGVEKWPATSSSQ